MTSRTNRQIGAARGEVTSRFRAFVLWAPVVLFPLVMLETFAQFRAPQIEKMVAYAIKNLLFFNTLHIVLTFYFFARFEGFQNAVRASMSNRTGRFAIMSLALLFLGPVVYFAPRYFFTPGSTDYAAPIAFASALVPSFLSVNHVIWQTRGIGLSYGEDRSEGLVRIDKMLFLGLLAAVLVVRGVLIGFGDGVALTIVAGFTITGAAVVGLLMAISLKRRAPNRAVFYFRLFYVLLIPFSSVAAFVGPWFHGLEYLDYFRRLNPVEPTVRSKRYRRVAGALLTVIVFILLLPFIGFLQGDFAEPKSFALSWIIGLNFGLSFVHYYFDEKIFAFSNPKTREALRPFTERRSA